jgi:integrase
VAGKNKENGFVPAMPELQNFLASLKRHWESDVDMQTRVSHWLRDLEGKGLIGAGTTLHGLRVSYAAWWKRTGGANNSEIADLLGDKSE